MTGKRPGLDTDRPAGEYSGTRRRTALDLQGKAIRPHPRTRHMMMQVNPPIPLDTPKGPAYAHMTIDYSQEHYVLFVCFLAESGECWVFPNRDVRLQKNITMGVRTLPSCACHVAADRPAATR